MRQSRKISVRAGGLVLGLAGLGVVGAGVLPSPNGWLFGRRASQETLLASVASRVFGLEALDEADFLPNDEAQETLGQLLFHDKILSGNMNFSCATCHTPFAMTGDGLRTSLGEGPMGVSLTRTTGEGADAVPGRAARNAQPLYNVGHTSFTRAFFDGRVEFDPTQPQGIGHPLGEDLPEGLNSLLAAQSLVPPAAFGVAGAPFENEVAAALGAGDPILAYEILTQRVRDIPEYVDMFTVAFDDVQSADDITIAHIVNSIGTFMAGTFRATETPFDRFMRGDTGAMSARATNGLRIFMTKGNCVECHNGPLLSDFEHHVIGIPQIGPGNGQGPDGRDDFGRESFTGDPDDRFRFRTAMLRNVGVTGPYGHSGAYDTLEEVVAHHLNAKESLASYEVPVEFRPFREDLDAVNFIVQGDPNRVELIASRLEIDPVELTDREFADLIIFLREGLTDVASLDLLRSIPESVPSGLPVFD